MLTMRVSDDNYSFLLWICLLLMVIGCGNREKTPELRAEITLPSMDQEIREGEIVFFEGVVSGGTPPCSYIWDFGKTMPPIKKDKSGPVIFNYEGAYKVQFLVKDSKGNEDTDSVRIIVSPKS